MADLDDLGRPSITELSTDEQLELLRLIRLSRRTPTKPATNTIRKTYTPKAIQSSSVSSNMAAELLKILTGDK